MSLEAFNNLSLNGDHSRRRESTNSSDDKFFEDVEEATKRALNREQIKESLQQRYKALPDQALVKQYRTVLNSIEQR